MIGKRAIICSDCPGVEAVAVTPLPGSGGAYLYQCPKCKAIMTDMPVLPDPTNIDHEPRKRRLW